MPVYSLGNLCYKHFLYPKLCKRLCRLFTVPCFSVRSQMSIVESDGPPSWSLDVSETGESTKCLWVGVMGLKAWGEVACRDLHHPYPRAFCTLPSFARIKRPRWRPVGLHNRHLRSNGKIGDCEQSKDFVKLQPVLLFRPFGCIEFSILCKTFLCCVIFPSSGGWCNFQVAGCRLQVTRRRLQ